MSEQEQRWSKPASGKSFLLGILVLLLLGVVVWLLSERNSRQWSLQYEGNTLSVRRGLPLPFGRQAFKTDDPVLAQAYAPIKPPPGTALEMERTFEDRGAMDQALFELLARWARADLAAGPLESAERAMVWIARAEKLTGISATQRDDLRNLRGEVGYFEARQMVDRSAEGLRTARERLRLTSGSSSPFAAEANEAVRKLDGIIDEVHQVGRALSTKPRELERLSPLPPAPQPAQTPPASSGSPPGKAEADKK